MQLVYPVEAWGGYRPTISQGYHPPEHEGVDIMFRRDGNEGSFPLGSGSTKNYFMPDGVAVCAAADGVLWHAGRISNGFRVFLDHGKALGVPACTLYLHLATLDVPEVQGGAGGIRVKAGQRLGTVGASPLDGEHVKHLHFEIWSRTDGGPITDKSHIDPAPHLAGAPLPQPGRWKLWALIGGLLALVGLTKRKAVS